MPANFKRHELNLFDQSDETQNFKIGHNAGVVTLTVPAQQFLTVSGKATFTGSTTCVVREDGGVNSTHSLESLFDGIDSGLATLTSDLASEVSRATSAEGVLDAKIDAQILAVTNTDAANHAAAMAAITAETTRAQQAEGVLQTNINNETTRAQAAELAINNTVAALGVKQQSDHDSQAAALVAETSRAVNAETTIQADVDANEAAAAAALLAASTTLQSNIDTTNVALNNEVSRATTAEAGLQASISNIISNTDPGVLDSLTEIVAHFSAADSDTTNILALLIARVSCIESVINTLLDPDLPPLDAVLQAASA